MSKLSFETERISGREKGALCKCGAKMYTTISLANGICMHCDPFRKPQEKITELENFERTDVQNAWLLSKEQWDRNPLE